MQNLSLIGQNAQKLQTFEVDKRGGLDHFGGIEENVELRS